MEKRTLRKYMGTSAGYLIGAIVYACFAAGFVLMANALDKTDSFDFGLILICTQWPTAVVLLIYAIQYLRMQSFFSKLEKEGRLDAVLADFQAAERLVNDGIRMGNSFVYVKGKRKLLSYDEICGLRQIIETIIGSEYNRKLMYKTPSGRERELCKLETFGKSNGDVLRIKLIVNMKRGEVNWPVV